MDTREGGVYTLNVGADQAVAVSLPVAAAMHVSIVGCAGQPVWACAGTEPAFAVAADGYLSVADLTVEPRDANSGGPGGTPRPAPARPRGGGGPLGLAIA